MGEGPPSNEIIEDPIKAEEIARTSDYPRTEAAKARAKLATPYTPALKEQFRGEAEYWDRRAEQLEQVAAATFDLEKRLRE